MARPGDIVEMEILSGLHTEVQVQAQAFIDLDNGWTPFSLHTVTRPRPQYDRTLTLEHCVLMMVRIQQPGEP
jgi:hypothetical protein